MYFTRERDRESERERETIEGGKSGMINLPAFHRVKEIDAG